MGAVGTGPAGSQSSAPSTSSSVHTSVPAPDGVPPSAVDTLKQPVGPTETLESEATKPPSNETQQTEDIPSFSEWAKKQLKEAEKNKGENLTWGGQAGGNGNHRKKNYASPDCGAKVVNSNPEAISPSALLSPNRDEYLLNPCTAKIWVVVELCEAIQPQRIELANFELFSSSPRELTVYLSDYPSREWTEAASLTAKDERNIQSFALPHLPQFVKFIKLEFHSHYGTEHFCPLSLFRVFGTSEYEVLESVDGGPPTIPNQPEVPVVSEEVDLDVAEVEIEGAEPKNLFGSAKAAVLSLVRRAAEVLVVKSPGVANSSCREEPAPQYTDHCITPSYLLVCDNCTDHFFYRVYNLVCCQQEMLKSLMSSSFVSSVLESGSQCSKIGLDWTKTNNETQTKAKPKTSPNTRSLQSDYLSALLPSETIAALCNMMAVSRRKIVLNMTSLEEPTLPVEEPPREQVDLPPVTVDTTTPTVDPVMSTTPPLNNSLVDISPTSALPPINITANINSSSSIPQDQNVQEGNDTQVKNDSKGSDDSKAEVEVNATLVEPGLDAMTLDSIFSVLEDEPEQGSVRATTTHQHKESVFVRLANRIKVLETNLSLSSAYLEELSLRYKKQVDELQKSLNSVMEERRQALEREAVLTAQVSALVQRVDAITSAMAEIIMERESWFSKLTSAGQHGIIIAIEVSLFVLVLTICKWLGNGEQTGSGPRRLTDLSQNSRRKSLDDIMPRTHNRKRRPSEEALTVSGSTHNELLLPLNNNGGKRKTSRTETRRKKKRKKELEEQQQSNKVCSVSSIEINRVETVDKPSNGNGAVRATVPCESSTDSRPGSVESNRPESTEPPLGPRAPSFIRTALWSRKQRSSVSSGRQESISSQDTQTSTKSKKGGVFKKFVRKIF